MSDYLIDTNCLLSFFTDRNPEQCEVVAGYIERAADLSVSLYVTPSVVTELVYVLGSVYEQEDGRIAEILASTFATPGIDFLERHPIASVLELWPGAIRDYGDAALAAVAQDRQMRVLTFDKTFAREMKTAGIPHQLLSRRARPR